MTWVRMSIFSRSSHLIFFRPLSLLPVTFILTVLLVIQWRIQGGFLVARKPPPPDRYFFLNQGVTLFTGTVLHQLLKCSTFGNPLRPTLDTPLSYVGLLASYHDGRFCVRTEVMCVTFASPLMVPFLILHFLELSLTPS